MTCHKMIRLLQYLNLMTGFGLYPSTMRESALFLSETLIDQQADMATTIVTLAACYRVQQVNMS